MPELEGYFFSWERIVSGHGGGVIYGKLRRRREEEGGREPDIRKLNVTRPSAWHAPTS